MTSLVFTVDALKACLSRDLNWPWRRDALTQIPEGLDAVVESVVTADGSILFFHRTAQLDDPLLLIIDADAVFSKVAPGAPLRAVFERAATVFEAAQRPKFKLPATWSLFRADNRVAFYATRRSYASLRWIAEIRPDHSDDVVFWRAEPQANITPLECFEPDYAALSALRRMWREQAVESTSRLRARPLPEAATTALLDPAVDLDSTSFVSESAGDTYDAWLPRLTNRQRDFVTSTDSTAIKLRGPAGSGKTLALVMRALMEVYRAAEHEEDVRVLFATHSWGVAEQIDAAIAQLDSKQIAARAITVYPLLTIVDTIMPSGHTGGDLEVVGDDSFSGKQSQLELIEQIIEEFVSGDWLAFRSQATPFIRALFDAPAGSASRNALVWDLMVEFGTVLGANGIFGGFNALRRYREIPRMPWMMPLGVGDYDAILQVYSKYIGSMSSNRQISSDQLVNDFYNYLSTFAWNIRRADDGFDIIFVDELHLFTEQERLVLQYLTRDASSFPRMYMALDPRQSPAEVYMNVDVAAITRQSNERADAELGQLKSVELSAVHRFTPQVLNLVRCLNAAYPALELGGEWELDLTDVTSSREKGATPVLHEHETEAAAIAAALDEAVADQKAAQGRVAVVALEHQSLRALLDLVAERKIGVVAIESRDDIASLGYVRRALVVGGAEYVAGLQFDKVIVAGIPRSGQGDAYGGHRMRRFLSLLYLAITRAQSELSIHCDVSGEGVPVVLQTAIDTDVLHHMSG